MVNSFDYNKDIMRVEVPESAEGINISGLREAAMEVEDYKKSVGLNGNTDYVVGYDSEADDSSAAFNQVPLTGYITPIDEEEEFEDLDLCRQIPVATVLKGYSEALNTVESLTDDLEDYHSTNTRIYGLNRRSDLIDAIGALETDRPVVEINLTGEPVNLEYRENRGESYFELRPDWENEMAKNVDMASRESNLNSRTNQEIRHIPDEEKFHALERLRETLDDNILEQDQVAFEEADDENVQFDH